MILETAGVGIVVPFLQIFVGDGANDYLINFFNSIGIYTKSKNDLIQYLKQDGVKNYKEIIGKNITSYYYHSIRFLGNGRSIQWRKSKYSCKNQ